MEIKTDVTTRAIIDRIEKNLKFIESEDMEKSKEIFSYKVYAEGMRFAYEDILKFIYSKRLEYVDFVIENKEEIA